MRAHWQSRLAGALAAGIQPAAFWQLSVAEWRALAAIAVDARLDRPGLAALAARFPDQPVNQGETP